MHWPIAHRTTGRHQRLGQNLAAENGFAKTFLVVAGGETLAVDCLQVQKLFQHKACPHVRLNRVSSRPISRWSAFGVEEVSVTIQTVVSVVRSLTLSLPFWLLGAGCTLQHTGELTRQVGSDLGLRQDVSVSRSATWTLTDHTVVYLATPDISQKLKPHPR